METKADLNKQILELTIEIRSKHPTLSSFLDEMPITIASDPNPKVDTEKLKEYLESLKRLIKQNT